MLFSREFPVFPTGFRSLMFPRSPEQAKDYASKMIGAKLITKQTVLKTQHESTAQYTLEYKDDYQQKV